MPPTRSDVPCSAGAAWRRRCGSRCAAVPRRFRGRTELVHRVRRRRAEIGRRHRIDGTSRDVRRLLAAALEAERRAWRTQDGGVATARDPAMGPTAGSVTDTAGSGHTGCRLLRLAGASPDPVAVMSELRDHAWRSAAGRAYYERVRDLLGWQLVGAWLGDVAAAPAVMSSAGRWREDGVRRGVRASSGWPGGRSGRGGTRCGGGG